MGSSLLEKAVLPASTCLVRDDAFVVSQRTLLVLAAVVAGFTLLCVCGWYSWWLFSTSSIDIIRSCCGRNAGHTFGGYDDTNLPDAEITVSNNGDTEDRRDNTITVYVAKEIVTMDPTWPTAKVVACQYGRILGIGQSLQDLDPWLNRNGLDPNGTDVVIDRTFQDHVMVPGFIEQHGHPLIGGTALSLINVAYHDTVAPYAPMIPGCKTKAEVLQRLKTAHENLPLTNDGSTTDEFLVAWGFDTVVMGCHLTKEDLDAIDPSGKRRVFVWDCSMHFAFLNTSTMKNYLGLDISNGQKYSKKTVGVETDPKTGELTGAFLGIQAVQTYCKPLIASLMKPSRGLQSMHHLTEVARMGGITTMCELMLGGVHLGLELDLFRWFYDNPLTPCRCVCILDANKVKSSMSPLRMLSPFPNARAKAAARWIRNLQGRSSEKLIFNNGVKFFADDSFLGLSIQLRFPGYVEPSRRKGIWNMGGAPGAPFVRDILPFWKEGCRVHVHSNGDASQDFLTEVVQTLQTIHPRFDHRFCLEHYGISALHIHRKLKNLGVNVGVNVYYALLRGQLNEVHVGKDKAHAASRLKSMVDAGLVVAMHADTPVAPPRPLEEMWFACNRMAEEHETKDMNTSTATTTSKSSSPKNGDDSNSNHYPTKKPKQKLVSICPAERITPYQAMRMKTIDAAYIHGLDGILGSIEAGKFADFTILGENPLKSDHTLSLREIRVIATVVGGVKRMNTPQRKTVPVPPGDGLLGQILWLRAMSMVGTSLFPSLCRWALFKMAAWMGSSGTYRDAMLVANKRAASETVRYNTLNSSSSCSSDLYDLGQPFCAPVDEEFAPIACKHIKPTRHRSNFKFRCC